MKRSISDAECCDLAELNSRHQITVNQVLGSHDLVPTLIAPLLDLRSLYNLSRVNRRLRELLYWTPTLKKVRHYKGTRADLPGTLLAYPDIQITRYMAESTGHLYEPPWRRAMFTAGQTPAATIEHLLGTLVEPLLKCDTLSDDELTDHMIILHRGLVEYHVCLENDTVFTSRGLVSAVLMRVARRIRNSRIFFWYFDMYITVSRFEEGEALLHKYVLIAQSGANVIVRDTIIDILGRAYVHHAGPLLFAAVASDRVDFFKAEYARLKQCVSIGTLLAVAVLCTGTTGNVSLYLFEIGRRDDFQVALAHLSQPTPDAIEAIGLMMHLSSHHSGDTRTLKRRFEDDSACGIAELKNKLKNI